MEKNMSNSIIRQRKHKALNSWDLKNYYRYFKKKRKSQIGEKQFGDIFRACMTWLVDNCLCERIRIKLPHRVGEIWVNEFVAKKVKNKEGKYVTKNPIDWGNTNKLWAVDEEARNDKILIRFDDYTHCYPMYKCPRGYVKNGSVYRMRFKSRMCKVLYDKILYNKRYKFYTPPTLIKS